jgi:hypothetical protein
LLPTERLILLVEYIWLACTYVDQGDVSWLLPNQKFLLSDHLFWLRRMPWRTQRLILLVEHALKRRMCNQELVTVTLNQSFYSSDHLLWCGAEHDERYC